MLFVRCTTFVFDYYIACLNPIVAAAREERAAIAESGAEAAQDLLTLVF